MEKKSPCLVKGNEAFEAGSYAQALDELLPFATGGNVGALFRCAHILGFGLAGHRDGDRAFLFMREAACKEHVRAQHGLGLFYLEGCGTESCLKEASRWIRKAAKGGFVPSQVLQSLIRDSGLLRL